MELSLPIAGMASLGRFFIILGLVLILLGAVLSFTDTLSFLKLGRLPGDLHIRRGNFSIYFPVTTCILISIVLTLIFFLFRK